MTRVVWRLREFMRQNEIGVQELARAMGGKRAATLYRLTSPTDTPSRVDLPTLAAVIGTLRRLTGKDVLVSDVFEVVEEEEEEGEPDDMLFWEAAELHPLLQPDAHGQLDIESLGVRLTFDPQRGWVSDEKR